MINFIIFIIVIGLIFSLIESIIENLPKIITFATILVIIYLVFSNLDLILNNILPITIAFIILAIGYGIYKYINSIAISKHEENEAKKRLILRDKILEAIDNSGQLDAEQVANIVFLDKGLVENELKSLAQLGKINYESFKINENERKIVYKSIKHKALTSDEITEEYNLD